MLYQGSFCEGLHLFLVLLEICMKWDAGLEGNGGICWSDGFFKEFAKVTF